MILNLDDLTVTTFATTPGGGGELGDNTTTGEFAGPLTNTCPPTRYATNCLDTCITCAAGCETSPGYNC